MPQFLKNVLVISFLCITLLVSSSQVVAQGQAAGGGQNAGQAANATIEPAVELCDGKQCYTEIGTVPLEPAGLVTKIMTIALAMGGALALILMMYGGFKLVTSAGDQVEIRKAKDTIQYAIIGLVLILFSVLIVNVIAGGVLQIPSFG